jgi:hypothetical protein
VLSIAWRSEFVDRNFVTNVSGKIDGNSETDSLIRPSMGTRMLGVSACSMGALARLIENPEINAHTHKEVR